MLVINVLLIKTILLLHLAKHQYTYVHTYIVNVNIFTILSSFYWYYRAITEYELLCVTYNISICKHRELC